MYALIDISNQMLEDSAFDMEGEIRGEATASVAKVLEGILLRVGNRQSCEARRAMSGLRHR
jgi:HK97 family phage major capsid protein